MHASQPNALDFRSSCARDGSIYAPRKLVQPKVSFSGYKTTEEKRT
jgi:hypothetical protein